MDLDFHPPHHQLMALAPQTAGLIRSPRHRAVYFLTFFDHDIELGAYIYMHSSNGSDSNKKPLSLLNR